MNHKKIAGGFGKQARRILLFVSIFASLNLISCGADESETDEGIKQLTPEEQKDLARFVEYVFFSTAPYIDKSWVETDVPEDEVAKNFIDFATETAAIQQVYTEVYNAYNAGDTNAVLAHFYVHGLEFQRRCIDRVIVRATSPPTMRGCLDDKCDEKDKRSIGRGAWGPTSLLTEFYIRRGNISNPWPTASAKGFNSISGTTNSPGVTCLYLIKQGDKWLINQLVTDFRIPDYKNKPPITQYFDDPKYKAPE